ncbi:MAG: hypothetical protein JXQ90_04330, partial [Cyclobacteriaceae bacterium]
MLKNVFALLAVFAAVQLMGQNQSVLLNGTSDYISIANGGNIIDANKTSFTIEFWYKSQEGTLNDTIIGIGDESSDLLMVGISAAGQIVLDASKAGGGVITSTTASIPVDGKWHHVAIAYGGSTEIFVDGSSVEMASATYNGEIMDLSTKTMTIGFGNGDYTNGWIDEVRFWSTNRANFIAGYDSLSLVGNETNLVAYFNFDKDFDNYATSSGAAYKGVAVGEPTISSDAPDLTYPIEINVTGNGIDILDGDTSPRLEDFTVFESFGMNDSSATRSFVVENNGYNVLNVTNVTSSNPLFDVSSTGFEISGGFTNTLTITYNAVDTTTQASTITLTNTDPDENPYTFRVQAKATSNALDFESASGDYLTEVGSWTPASANGSAMTIAAWVKPEYTNMTDTLSIISKRRATSAENGVFELLLLPSRHVLGVWGSGSSYDTAISTNQFSWSKWNHVAMVSGGADLVMIVNGVAGDATPLSGSVDAPSGSNVLIGALQEEGGTIKHYFDGQMDELSVWSTGRSMDQILSQAANGISTPGSQADLLAYYKFDQGVPGANNARADPIDVSSNGFGSNAQMTLNGVESNYVLSTIPTSIAPTIIDHALSQDNGTLTVTFNQGVYANSNATGNLTTADFNVTSSTGVTGYTVTHTAGSNIVTVSGITYNDLSDGDQTMTIRPADDNSVFDAHGGSQLSSDDFEIPMNDNRPAEIIGNFYEGGYVDGYTFTVSFDEAVYANNDETGGLQSADFNVTLTSGNASINTISVGHTAGQTDVDFNIDFIGAPDGSQTLAIDPIANSVYDTAGNSSTTGQANNSWLLLDDLIPTGYSVSFDTISQGLSTLDFTIQNGETNSRYEYEISSDGGGSISLTRQDYTSDPLTVTGVDISSLSEGLLTMKLVMIDSANNKGDTVSAQGYFDQTSPIGYSVVVDTLASGDQTIDLSVSGGETNSKVSYTITSDGGGTLNATAIDFTSDPTSVNNIDISSLTDGLLTISVNMTDSLGNVGEAVSTSKYFDSTAPSGYSVAIDTVAHGNQTISFTLSGGESTNTTYSYTITSDNGGSILLNDQAYTDPTTIADLDISSLSEGVLTVSVSMTDSLGNEGTAVTATSSYDGTAPSGYSVAIDTVAHGNQTISFTLSGGESESTTYGYTITSDNGGSVSLNDQAYTDPTIITDLDISSLSEGVLTVSISMTDSLGNEGTAVTATSSYDGTAPSGYSVAIDTVAHGNQTISFTLSGGESTNTTYSYTITSDNGGSILLNDQAYSDPTTITDLDISSLSEGVLTVSVSMT